MIRGTTPTFRTQADRPSLVPTDDLQLMVVMSAAVLDAPTYKWTYQVAPAVISATTPFGVSAKPNIASYDPALSVSELGNTLTHVCGGVPVGDLLGSFEPKPLHVGCAVWCKGWRRSDGTFAWLIVSPTQSISGAC